jgi:hypothetical protein
MPGGFTWADAFAGFQAGGQAAIDAGGVLAGVGVAFVLAVLAFGWAACVAAGRADRMLDVARERDERSRHHGAAVNTDPCGFDDIYPDSNLTHRRAS